MPTAIATFAELKASIIRRAGSSGDSDFAAYAVPEAIMTAESEMNSRLRVPEMMARAHATFDEAWEDLPDGFLEMRQVWLVDDDDDTETPLAAYSPERIAYIGSKVFGTPKGYCVSGTQIRLEPRSTNETYTIRMLYYAQVPDLSASSPETKILTRYPRLYLYGSLAGLEGWLLGPDGQGDARLAVWRTEFERELAMVNGAHGRRVRGWAA